MANKNGNSGWKNKENSGMEVSLRDDQWGASAFPRIGKTFCL